MFLCVYVDVIFSHILTLTKLLKSQKESLPLSLEPRASCVLTYNPALLVLSKMH